MSPALQRAHAAEDKEARRQSILDAAESVLQENPERIPSADELAARAGISKGTVYLYFAAKEDVLLALHERHKDRFFDALVARGAENAPITIDTMIELAHRYITGVAAFLPLAALSMGLMDKGISPAAALAFKQRLGIQLQRCGEALDRHFRLPPGEGSRLLTHSYGLIIGLWHMATSERRMPSGEPCVDFLSTQSYPAELEQALRDLWAGRIARAATA